MDSRFYGTGQVVPVVRLATPADIPQLRQWLDEEWPEEEGDGLDETTTLMVDDVGFVSWFIKDDLFPVVKHFYIRPSLRQHGIGQWLANIFLRTMRSLGYGRVILPVPKSRPYIGTAAMRMGSMERYAEDEHNKYFLVSTEVRNV
jgi:GNAT superfamily N-acetyltransferase